MKAIIIANGQIHDSDFDRSLVAPTDLVICADGGASNALALGLQPQVVVGDLDSLDESVRSRLEKRHCQFIVHPARKDETDLELALYYAIEHGVDEILILGALGGRIDQALANVQLLALPELHSVKAKILDGRQEVFLIRDEALIKGQMGDTLSLLPLTEEVTGIYTEGLEYPLENGTLYLGPARGVSNTLTAPRARVQVGQGLLLAVMIHNSERRFR
ncbi:MAG: thiamine diphosphokinase [Anaerolineae bacterium]